VVPHPTWVMHALVSPTNSPNPPRSNMKIRARPCTACSWWAPEMAAEIGHKEEQSPPLSVPSSVSALSKKDRNSHLHPPRSFPTILFAPQDHGSERSAAGRAMGESDHQWLQARSAPSRGWQERQHDLRTKDSQRPEQRSETL